MWENRIVGYTEEAPDQLLAHYANPRTHDGKQRDAMRASLDELGIIAPCTVNDRSGNMIDGHMRCEEYISAGIKKVPVNHLDLSEQEELKAIAFFDRIGALAGTNQENLEYLLENIHLDNEPLENLLEDIRDKKKELPENIDDIPEVKTPISKLGDLWLLDGHRVLCGDSTDQATVERLMDGKKADMVFTDPPYGVGFENVGVLNDNQNEKDLIKFNKQWIDLALSNMKENGSLYIWGTERSLLNIYAFVLYEKEQTLQLTMKSLITWDKGFGQYQNAEHMRRYPVASEKCIFYMCGKQEHNNNADNYFEGFEPIRAYLATEMEKVGGKKKWVQALGNQMGSHYFTRSQWCMPTRENYEKLQTFAKGDAFKKDYDEIKKDYDKIKDDWYATRAYFDNTHDNMNDVWRQPTLAGKERKEIGDHATPKPVELCMRGLKTSSREGEITLDLFLGSGSTLIACEQTDRICYGLELDPHYVDVICKRWQTLTGQLPVLEATGEAHDFIGK